MLSARHNPPAPARPVRKLPPIKIAQAVAKHLPGRFSQAFLAVFAAIISAAVLLIICYALLDHISSWENRKQSVIALVKENGRLFGEAYDEASLHSGAAARALEVMKTLETQRLEEFQILADILRNKPFFLPLWGNESEILRRTEEELGLREPEQKFVHITESSQIDSGFILPGTQVQLVGRDGDYVHIVYEGKTYALLASKTDAR